MAVEITADERGCAVPIFVTPRAGRSAIAGERKGALWVKLAAPPVDGAANQALVDLLAKHLNIPKSSVHLISGATGRKKRVHLVGVTVDAVRQRLGLR